MTTISEALSRHTELDSDTALLDASLLLCEVLGCHTSYLRTWPEKKLTAEQIDHYEALFSERKTGRPIAHILGHQAFWTLDLAVSEHTLIPRQDTETLVETALALDLPDQVAVLDLGTGTGAIALALAKENPSWSVQASDLYPEVVELARSNASRNHLTNVEVVQSDWFSSIKSKDFDLIVSNPPYIDERDEHLSLGDVRFEAKSALVASEQGLADLRLLIDQARDFLKREAWLMVEHGYDQGERVRSLLRDHGYHKVETRRDLGGNDRLSLGQWQG